jgi:aryl-alcohol dehydrogenase-like predicted oxidoreductase
VSSKGSQHQIDQASAVGAKAIQVVYNRLDRRPEEAVFPSCQRQNLGVLARVPMASGYLSGKYKPGATFVASDVRSTHDQADVAAKLAEVERIQREEVPAGVPLSRWALAWCLKHEAVSAVIPGCRNVGQVRENAAAAELVGVDPDSLLGSRECL